jgi:hypothetical protein
MFLAIPVGIACGQEAPTPSPTTDEHQWLQRFVGKWVTKSRAEMEPGQEAVEGSGTIVSRSIGGRWLVNEMTGEMAGFKFIGIQTIGYDAAKKQYVGSWVDSTNDFMWQYKGSVDKDGKVLTLEAEGPDMHLGNKMRQYRDVYEFKTDDEIAVSSLVLNDDGKWFAFMTGTAQGSK